MSVGLDFLGENFLLVSGVFYITQIASAFLLYAPGLYCWG